MIEIQKGLRSDYITFYDSIKKSYVGIIFFTVNRGKKQFCVSCCAPYGGYHDLEEILNVVEEPLLTPLLFDLKIIDEIFDNLEDVDWI